MTETGSRTELHQLFPRDFIWGAATAAYQIEGAVREGGRGPSIWDTFAHTPGRVANGDTGDIACDHYHRYREDIQLVRDLGVQSYRFSVSWPRIQPEGKGPALRDGIDFYDRLLDEVCQAGLVPHVTIYHWDLPQALEDAGGWTARDTVERFVEYALLVHEELGDRVPFWVPLNEPFCSAFLGYAVGCDAPGRREGHQALAAAHHLLVAHGETVRAMREARYGTEEIGIALNIGAVTPATDSAADRAAATRLDLLTNRAFTDPLFGGRYPDDEAEVWGEITDFSFRRDGDLELIGQPLDFVGVNYYFPEYAKHAPDVEPVPENRTAVDIGVTDNPPAELHRTASGWPVEADGLLRLLRWLRDRYPGLPPIQITENGTAFPDSVRADTVDDPERRDYLESHLRALAAAMAEGVDVRGYFYWTLLDNFEWANGYSKRFGLVHVDFTTQRRTPKNSYYWYQELISRVRAGEE